MPIPDCGTIAGLTLTQQAAAIYCALREGEADPGDLPSCQCVDGRTLPGILSAIYCLFYRRSFDPTLLPCNCVSGNPIGPTLDAIYCAIYIQAGSPAGLDSCACVRGKTINGKVDAIYCVLRSESGDESLPSCDCVRGVPLNDKLSAIFEAVLNPVPTGGASLIVSWDDNSGIEDGFRVEISTDGVAYSVAGITPPNVLTFTIENLQFNTLYWVRVYAFNEFGDSPVLGPAQVYTPPEFGPTNLQAVAISDSAINLNWNLALVPPVTGYKVYFQADGAPEYSLYTTVGNGISSAPVTGLNSSTVYNFQVSAYNENGAQPDGETLPSNTASSKTWPVLDTASVSTTGLLLSLHFSEAVNFGAGGNGGWTITPTAGAATVSYASGAGTDTLIYTVNRAIQAIETLTVSYVQPGNGVQSVSDGGDVASITNYAVTNNSTYVAYLLSEDFSGTGTPAGFTISSGTFNFDATDWPGGVPAGLTQSVKFTANNQIGYWSFTSSPNVYVFCALQVAAGSVVNLVPIRIGDTSSTNVCIPTFRSDLQLQITVGSSTTGGSYVQGTTYYLWLEYEKGTGANAVGRIYISTTQTKPGAPNVSRLTGTSTANGAFLRLDPGATGTLWMTKLRVSATPIGSNPA